MFDEFGRPDWDTYFITMCFLVAQRSIDPSTKHGCVVVDSEHAILSTGYNGPPRGTDDKTIPLTRPEKYPYLIHAEENAILNAARNGISLKGSTFYVTGHPCEHCFRMIRGVGAKMVIIGPVSSNCVATQQLQVINVLNKQGSQGVHSPIYQYKDEGDILNLFNKAKLYYDSKAEPKNQ